MAKRNLGSGTSRSGSKSRKKQAADAIQMLEADHRQVETLFNDFFKADDGRQQQLAQDIFRELEVHSTLEEEVFYPALQQQGESAQLTSEELDSVEELDSGIDADARDTDASETDEVDHVSGAPGDELTIDTVSTAYEDHRMVRNQITRLRQMDVSAPEFRQGMVELQEMVADHVSVEEDDLFTEAKISLDIQALGRKLEERKADILSEAA